MPFEVIDTLDPLTNMVQMRTSAIFELLMSIRAMLKPTRKQEAWAKRVSPALPPKLVKELSDLYTNFADGNIFLELPIDYEDHSDLPGFFEYVRGLSDVEFVFYLIGRTIPQDELASLMPHADKIRTTISRYCSDCHEWYGLYLDGVLADVSGLKDRLVNAWEVYWTTFFHQELLTFQPAWDAGIQEKTNILEREGGRVLLEKVTGHADLPPDLPPDVATTSITFTPVCSLPSRVYRFYGYGNVTVLYDPEFTEERKMALTQSKDEAMATLKALGDDRRLEILRLIVQSHKGNPHGKTIAAKLGISASAVSRHLDLLKEGNLITEEPFKNLISYRFNKETLLQLADKLLDYLYS
jgi:DNA-binding transcriptional ArsR family regulator